MKMSVPAKSQFLLEIAEIYDLVASEETSSSLVATVEEKFSDLLASSIAESTALAREFLFWVMKNQDLSSDAINVIYQVYSEQGYMDPKSEKLPKNESAEIEWLKQQKSKRL